MNERCDTCRFWENAGVEGNLSIGVCHRYPRTMMFDSNGAPRSAEQPAHVGDDWCGEWQPKRPNA
jgi:hypothetical protein